MFDVEKAWARILECKTEREYITHHIRLVDCFSARYLRDRELEVLTEMVAMGGEVTTQSRQVLMEKFGFSSNNLSNYIRELTKLEWLAPSKKGPVQFIVAAKAVPSKGFQQYAVQLTHKPKA